MTAMGAQLATLTIRNVPDDIKHALRVSAAKRGHSLEESLRHVLVREVRGADEMASSIDASEIMRRANELAEDPPNDARFAHFSQKEISDVISGEYEYL